MSVRIADRLDELMARARATVELYYVLHSEDPKRWPVDQIDAIRNNVARLEGHVSAMDPNMRAVFIRLWDEGTFPIINVLIQMLDEAERLHNDSRPR